MTNTPINYNTWDRSGKGKNILHLLTPDELKIWNAALPYQDARPNDRGHIEVVTYFALQLLEIMIGAERKVVIPATILHDIGWSQVSQESRDLFKNPYSPHFEEVDNPKMRRFHQYESIRLATGILLGSQYPTYSPTSSIVDILRIIGDHDTRDNFEGLNAHVMGDADRLWRFTVIECENYGWKPVDFIARCRKNLEKRHYLLTPAGSAIAEAELKNTEAYFG